MSEDNVVYFSRPTETEPGEQLRGEAVCLSCKKTWQAVAPLGSQWLECPSCKLEQGRFVGNVQRKEDHWTCPCGVDLFYATNDGVYCPGCGLWQKGF